MKLKSDLTKIAQRAPELAAEALRQTGNDIVTITKQLVPVKTGDLQRSYKVEVVSDKQVLVGSDIEYAPHVEFGTVHQSAQPSLLPAFAQSISTFKARLKQAMERIT